MSKKITSSSLLICSAIAFIISLRLFWNMGIYVDEYNTNPAVVCGGELWLYMDWLRLGLLGLITLLSGIKLFQK